jgi:TolB-like protein/DNA-binding winged helix-turn-helix (wHTH) protein/Tfp pilus assembly protein PilF
MPPSTDSPQLLFRFGVFQLDARAGELHKRGMRLPIQGLPIQVLCILLQHAGKLVTREELRNQLWPPDTFVDFDHSLHNAIARLREALGDSSTSPRFIETVPRKGYRFVGDVEDTSMGASDSAEGPAQPKVVAATRPARSRLWVPLGAAAIILAIGSAVYVRDRRADVPLRPHSLAVLPLENLTGQADQEYLVDGMTDELITSLAKIGSLRVISRTSIMPYKSVRKPLREIARELNVDAIVEGTLSRSGSHVRITARLIDAATDRLLWGENYDRELGDAVALQNQIATAIATELPARLTPGERARLASAHSVDPAAYELYLKGRYFWVKRTEESFRRAMDYFRQAIDRDPGYAAPYSGLADCFVLFGSSFDVGGRAPSDVQPKARAAALKALELDDSLGDAHSSLAYVKLNYDWDWTGAEAEFKRSLTLNPGYAHGHHWYAHLLLSSGRQDEALAESTRALELDPLSPIINVHLAWHYLYTRQYDRALDQATKTLDLDPSYALAHWYRGLAFGQKGMYVEALRELERARELLPGNPAVRSDIGYVHAVAGNEREAERVIGELKEESARRYVTPYELALIQVGLGKRDQAFEWLEQAFRDRSDQVIYLAVDPRLDAIRSDPRFDNLVRRVGIPH